MRGGLFTTCVRSVALAGLAFASLYSIVMSHSRIICFGGVLHGASSHTTTLDSARHLTDRPRRFWPCLG